MNAREIVQNDIVSCIHKALKFKILINPKISGGFFDDKSRITSKYTRFSDEEDYLEKYYEKYEGGEYLAAFPDGAFFQINYEFNMPTKYRSYLIKANLCYLPPVSEDGIKNEYIRFDYNNSSDNSFFHAFAHIHIGFQNDLRIPASEIPLFSEFFEMILYFFYPNDYRTFFNNGKRINSTVDSQPGRLTKSKVLIKELEKCFYLKIASV